MYTLSPSQRAPASSKFLLREPGITDGASLHQLIQACPPLDLNSPYAYLLLCAHHPGTCVLAENEAGIAGFVSAYRLPAAADTVFVWQVAVAPAARGQGLALRMLQHLLARPALAGCRWLETTVTPSNQSSRKVFDGLAAHLGVRSSEREFFAQEVFGNQGHEPEMLIRMGPLRHVAVPSLRAQENEA